MWTADTAGSGQSGEAFHSRSDMTEPEQELAVSLGWDRGGGSSWVHRYHGSLVRYANTWWHHPRRNETGGDDKPVTPYQTLGEAVEQIGAESKEVLR